MAFSAETSWDRQYHMYNRWRSDNSYKHYSGTFAIPLAVDGNETSPTFSPVALVQAHAPYSERAMSFTAKKKGSPPIIPSPASSGSFEFLGGQVNFNGPSVNQSMTTYDWEVSGQYLFIQDCRFDTADGYVLTGFPFPTTIQAANIKQLGGVGPSVGPVADAGQDVLTGYTQANQINFNDLNWVYNTPTYFPGKCLNEDIAIGGIPPLT